MTQAFWVIVVAGLLMFLQIVYFRRVAFRKLSYSRTISRRAVYEGERIQLVEVISNNKLTPLPWLRVESRLSPYLQFRSHDDLSIKDDRFHRSVFFVRSFSRITRRYDVLCAHRGYFDLSNTTLTAGDLFGMAAFPMQLQQPTHLFVYPAALSDEQLPQEALRWQGDISVRRWIFPDPILINGIREYRTGDSRKDIHWKASARTGQLQVKTHDYTVQPKLVLLLNIDPKENFWGNLTEQQQETVEYGIRVVATLSRWAYENDMDVGFYSNGTISYEPGARIALAPTHSDRQQELLLSTLAGFVAKQAESVFHTLERMVADELDDADILVVSAYWSDSLNQRCDALRRRGNQVTYIPFGEGGAGA